jgi:hypothetical protein
MDETLPLQPWVDLVQGRLGPDEREAVVDELLAIAPAPRDMVALLARLQRLASAREPSQSCIRRATSILADLTAPRELVHLRQVAAADWEGLRAAGGAEIRSYAGGGLEVDLMPGRSGLAGELRDASGRSLEGVTIYLTEETGRVLASALINSLGEFHLEGRVPPRFYLVAEGKWLRVDR